MVTAGEEHVCAVVHSALAHGFNAAVLATPACRLAMLPACRTAQTGHARCESIVQRQRIHTCHGLNNAALHPPAHHPDRRSTYRACARARRRELGSTWLGESAL